MDNPKDEPYKQYIVLCYLRYNLNVRGNGSYILTVFPQTVISLELLTVFVAGPLACLICYGIAKKDPRTNILIIIVATMELYGGFLTFCPEWLTLNYNLDTSNFMYKWVYLVFFNMLWVFIPIWAIWVAVQDINDAFASRSKTQSSRKAK